MNIDEKLIQINNLANDTAILRKSVIEELGKPLIELSAVIAGVIGSGGKIMIAGNGGSAADAQHFAGEMIVRLTSENNRQSLPAISLTADTAVLTAAANDYGFENIFSRQVEGLGQKGDLLFLISTSGNSLNLIKAAHVARERGIITVGLLGNDGGKLGSLVDKALIIPHPSTQRIQEEHIFLIHLLVGLVESDLF